MLYIAIPAMTMAPFLYADFWHHVHAYWSAQLPAFLLPALLLLLSGRGNIRTWLLDADLLFLIQKNGVLQQLKRCGLLSSLFFLVVSEVLLFVLAAPVLVGIYHFSQIQILSLFFMVSAFRLTVMTIKKFADKTLYRWLFLLLSYSLANGLVLTLHTALWLLCGTASLAALICLNWTQLAKTNRWFRDMEIENTEHVRLIRFILQFSSEIEKPLSIKRRPLVFFRRSGRLFKTVNKENGLLELLLKTFFRNKGYMLAYLQLTGITCLAVMLLPFWLKWCVYVLCIPFAWFWLKIVLRKMTASPFFRIVPFDPKISGSVQSRFQKWLGLPVILVTGIIMALSLLFSH